LINAVPLRWVPGQARVLPEEFYPRMSSQNLKIILLLKPGIFQTSICINNDAVTDDFLHVRFSWFNATLCDLKRQIYFLFVK
jgi:hypothetical protein